MNRFVRVVAVALLSAFALPALAGGRPVPIVEIENAPVAWPDSKAGKLETVQVAILRGLMDKGWAGRVVSPGVIRGTLRRDDWMCEIEIPFNTSTYSIRYADSQNLDYNAEKRVIHRNFNKWLVLLQQRIDFNMAMAPH